MTRYNPYQRMSHQLRYGKREPHKGTWTLYYGSLVLAENKTYATCQALRKEFGMMGRQFPDKTKFSIKPYK